ncbi:hypothetical protein PINS_up007222 [Pythium insidiosum]|nr:hypothetical protein PINS_up007222 [Pythium insidiosum]
MFIYTLQKRHHDNEEICRLAAQLVTHIEQEMPISSPVKHFIDATPPIDTDDASPPASGFDNPDTSTRTRRAYTLPAIMSPSQKPSPPASSHRPTTTMSALYVGAPSPYSSEICLPISRTPTTPREQLRRSMIYSTPKERAVAGDRKRRCLTPNIPTSKSDLTSSSDDLTWLEGSAAGSPPKGADATKKRVVLSEKYSWNPECINSVSGFEWWWRSLPQHHTSLEPTQKLKMVTKAAVRLHTKGEWERAAELYLLALSMDINEEVEFRLRVNLACAYEAGKEFTAAASQFQAALALNPDDPYARFKLGVVLQELGLFDEAEAEYRAVQHTYPQADDALKLLSECRERKHREDEKQRQAIAAARAGRSNSPRARQHQMRVSTAGSQSPPSPPSRQPHSPSDAINDANSSSTGDATPHEPYEYELGRDLGLVEAIVAASMQRHICLRQTLESIDFPRCGFIRKRALLRILCELLARDENAVLDLLAASQLLSDGSDEVVSYVGLVSAVESELEKSSPAHKNFGSRWREVVAVVKAEEADFYASAASRTQISDRTVFSSTPSEEEHDPCPHPSPHLLSGPSERDILHTLSQPAIKDDVENDDGGGTTPAISSLDPVNTIDGYHAVSPRMDEKRERAKEEAILRAERARIIARRHLHCVKALQELAQRARKHLVSRHKALTELRDVGRDARARVMSMTHPSQPPECASGSQQHASTPVLALARETCACAVSIAVRNVTLALEAQRFRGLVEQFAATSMSPAVVEVERTHF